MCSGESLLALRVCVLVGEAMFYGASLHAVFPRKGSCDVGTVRDAGIVCVS